MMPTPEVQERLRQYLLGQLSDDAREEIERDLLASDKLFEELLVIEDETIDDYLSGELTATDRTAFESHFLSTPDRHDQLKFGRAFSRYLFSESAAAASHAKPSIAFSPRSFASPRSSLSQWGSALFSSPFRVAVALVIMIGVAFGIWQFFFRQSEVDTGLVALNAAYREQRPVESRISKFDYAPYVVTRGSGDEKIDQNELRRAELTLLDVLNKNPAPAVHHALGKVYLAKKQFDEAIKEFDEALKGDSKNAETYSDLGAAWLEKGKIDRNGPEGGRGVAELGNSLESLNQALRLRPNLLEALFNRALCRQFLGPPKQAQDDWRSYLEKDSTSPWAEEARRNLKLLEQQTSLSPRSKSELLNEFLKAYAARDGDRCWQLLGISRDDLSGTNIFQQLVDVYLDHIALDKQEDAVRDLEQISYVGELAVRKGNEHYDGAVAAILKSSTRTQLAGLSSARQQMKLGFQAYAESQPDAVKTFVKAERMFTQSGDQVEVAHAKFWIAYCTLEEGLDTQRGLTMLAELARDCEQRKFRWLMMKTLQKTSSAKYNLKQYSAAIEYANRTLDLAQQLNDGIGKFDALDLLTELYRSINNYPQALNSLSQAQPLVNCCAFNPIKIGRHYGIAAFAFYSAGLAAAAIDSQQEAVRRAIDTGETSMICVSYANLGLILGKTGNYDDGLRSVNLAYEAASRHSDEARGQNMMAYSVLQRGHFYRNADQYANAIQSYDESIKIYESLKLPVQLYQAHKGRLYCYIKQANNALASRELDQVLSLIDANRSTIFEGDNRNKFFDLEQSVYDLGIAFTFEQMGDQQRAFGYSEESRARSLLDLILRGTHKTNWTEDGVSRPLDWSEIRNQLSANSQIVEYSVLPDRIVMWVLDQAGLTARQSMIGQTDLTGMIRRYMDSITDPKNSADSEQGKKLFSYLIQPVEDLLKKDKQIVIVPDKSLNWLPFGALVSPAKRYLVQDYCISYSPSATVYILKSMQAQQMSSSETEKLLSVGNPSFDHRKFPSLVDLPSAEKEARQVAADYNHARVFIGPNATKRNVTGAMPDSTVVHLALHYFEDENSETSSRMILAKDSSSAAGDDAGTLTADEIYGLRLPHTRLVVLSACQTGSGRYYRGEGTFSLARAFLVSGVPLVVASLWAVDSESAANLMIKFHECRTQNHYSSARALQQAQLSMIGSADERLRHPYFWAPFVMQGGYAAL